MASVSSLPLFINVSRHPLSKEIISTTNRALTQARRHCPTLARLLEKHFKKSGITIKKISPTSPHRLIISRSPTTWDTRSRYNSAINCQIAGARFFTASALTSRIIAYLQGMSNVKVEPAGFTDFTIGYEIAPICRRNHRTIIEKKISFRLEAGDTTVSLVRTLGKAYSLLALIFFVRVQQKRGRYRPKLPISERLYQRLLEKLSMDESIRTDTKYLGTFTEHTPELGRGIYQLTIAYKVRDKLWELSVGDLLGFCRLLV